MGSMGEERDITMDLIGYIAENGLPPGAKLPSIRDLASLWECSPSQVRSGLITCAALGIVDTHPRAGSFVRRLDEGQIEKLFTLFFQLGMSHEKPEILHLYELKTIIDAEIFPAAAKNRTEVELFELRNIYLSQESHIEDDRAFVDSDEEFHLKVASITRNPLVGIVLSAIQAMLRPDRYRNAAGGETRKEILNDHRRLYEAIQRQDSEEAKSLALEHSNRRKMQLLADCGAVLS